MEQLGVMYNVLQLTIAKLSKVKYLAKFLKKLILSLILMKQITLRKERLKFIDLQTFTTPSHQLQSDKGVFN